MPQANSRRPNVVFFFTDQQRWDTTGVHGNPLDLTPNFDHLATRGTHLQHCYTPQPVCGPARACLQTSLYATTNGCWKNGIALATNLPTLGTCFRDAGYRTAYIGKWHLGDLNRPDWGPVRSEQRGGYEDWLGSNILEFTSDGYHTTLYDNDNRAVKRPGYRVDAMTDAAIQYIDGRAQNREEPFLLFLSYLEPHHQNHVDDFVAPDGYRQRYTGRWIPPDLAALGGSTHQHLGGYYGCVKRLDEAFGRLIDALKSLDLLDDTIIVFTSDHGCHFKTRNPEYKRSCHDSSIRVPCAMAGPGFDGGGRVDQLVSLMDLTPTLLNACGIEVPSTMQGRSILPLLRGDSVDWPDDMFVQISESHVGRAIRTRRWKYSVRAPDIDGNGQANSTRYAEEFLYDLQHDPYELNNLIGSDSHAQVAERMRARLTARMKEAGEPQADIDIAPTRKSGHRRVSREEAES